MSKTFKQYQKQNGTKAWMFNSLYLGMDDQGKQVRVTRRGFPTQKAAKLEATKLKAAFDRGEFNKKTPDNSFQEIYELWFDSYKKTVKETTYVATERTFRLHILPTFGEIAISKIDMKLCQKTVNQWAEEFEHYNIMLQYASKVMDYAVHLELIVKNPFLHIIRPKKKGSREKKLKFYTKDQIQTIMAYLDNKAAANKNSSLYKKYFSEFDRALFRLLAFSGMRSGEALALEYSDFNFEDNLLSITKTITNTRTGYTISPPKTPSSNRVIPMDEKTMQIIKRWQLLQRKMLFSNRVKAIDGVFTDVYGERMIRQDIYQRANRLADANKLHRVGVHGYRHSHASMLFEAGATMKEAQVRLGHSSIEMTMNVYTHVTDKVKAETVEKLIKFANF